MTQIKAKQVDKIFSANVRVAGLSVGSGTTSTVATSGITTALGTAGDNGLGGTVGVPVQVSSSGGLGVVASIPNNRCEIYDSVSGDKILSVSSQEEVYGRLTSVSGVYTLSYFTTPNTGTEAAYTFISATSIDFELAYRFDFARCPIDALIGMQVRHISDDPAGSGAKAFVEQLTVTATDTIAPLTKTPLTASTVELIVNGISQDAMQDFTLSGKNITWNTGAAQFSVATTDRVIARYQTVE